MKHNHADGSRKQLTDTIGQLTAQSETVKSLTDMVSSAQIAVAARAENIAKLEAHLATMIDESGAEILTGSIPIEIGRLRKQLAELRDDKQILLDALGVWTATMSMARHDEQVLRDRIRRDQRPILLLEASKLAAEVIRLETLALEAKLRLRALASTTINSEREALGMEANAVLQSPPMNLKEPQLNSPQWTAYCALKKRYAEWRKTLESDPLATVDMENV